MTAIFAEGLPDADLWGRVRAGDSAAFEVLVRRHQSAVCSVAYSCCGDLALSEDVAQETFWAAWRDRAALAQPARLRSWLCGIARNLGNNARRRESRASRTAVALSPGKEPASAAPGPAEQAVSREEEAVVWQALEQVPEAYREPLVLFYREQLSVAEAASALDLSEDAVKQRLSRGREMLRQQVAAVVEGALRRSRPGGAFTMAVMAGLTAGVKSAFAAGAQAAAGAAIKAAGTGVSGALLGSAGGLFGGWLGTWLPAQLAPTNRERTYLLRTGRRMLLVSVLFMLALGVPILAFVAGQISMGYYLIFWVAWMVTFSAYIGVESLVATRAVRRIRAEATPGADANDSPLRAGLVAVTSRYRGRVYRSRATLFGLPLLDVNVGNPDPAVGAGSPAQPRIARGWVAVGEDARGVLLAVGGRACGFLAIGGVTFGVLSFGGVAFGIVAFGGVGVGVLGIGGLGVGLWALGGLAIGWEAVGGGAFAWHAAFGGAAAALEYAAGGAAFAAHANDEAAKAVLLDHPLTVAMNWYLANQGWGLAIILLLSVGLPAVLMALMYRREEKQIVER
jgi:RNA polymerase sigma factor (sigma-70 family)